MFKGLRKSPIAYVLVASYLALAAWWILIFLSHATDSPSNYWFGFAYSFVALVGGIYGLYVSRAWGGFKSLVGRGIIFLSLGLLSEWFGQAVWSYYNLVQQVEAPYPSIGDIGYFAIIPLYALGMWSFSKAAGARFSLRSINGKLGVVIIPLAMFTVSYLAFLKDIEIDPSNWIKTFLDFGYPIGEALTISVALVTFLLTIRMLGGAMKWRIFFLVLCFIVQYITDSFFLYRIANEAYYNGGPVDMMYATSFTLMALALAALRLKGNPDQGEK